MGGISRRHSSTKLAGAKVRELFGHCGGGGAAANQARAAPAVHMLKDGDSDGSLTVGDDTRQQEAEGSHTHGEVAPMPVTPPGASVTRTNKNPTLFGRV